MAIYGWVNGKVISESNLCSHYLRTKVAPSKKLKIFFGISKKFVKINKYNCEYKFT